MSLELYETEYRRLMSLRLLQEHPAYTLDETVLSRLLKSRYGLAVSRDRMKTDLAWLQEQGLIIAQEPGGVWISTLTVRGRDVSDGLTVVPGVARPEPGE